MPLVNAYHKRVSLGGEDLDLIYDQWLRVGPVHFDYSHCVAVDGEHPIWIAGNGNKAKAVPMIRVIIYKIAGSARGAHLFPCSTFTTASAVAGPPE